MNSSRKTLFALFCAACLILTACQPAIPQTGAGPSDPGPEEFAAAASVPASGTVPAFVHTFEEALKTCTGLQINQICIGHGQVESQTMAGSPASGAMRAGDTMDLADLKELRLLQATGQPDDWPVALLRMQADLEAGQSVMIVLLGSGTITHLEVIASEPVFIGGFDPEPASAQGDSTGVRLPASSEIEQLQGFWYQNGPVPEGSDPPLTGMILWTPPGEELASLRINGAVVTLGSTAFVEAQAGGDMSLAMADGTLLVEAAGSVSQAIGGMQIDVPLDGNGEASGPPSQAVVIDPRAQAISEAVSQYKGEPIDPRAQAISDAVEQYGTQPPIDPRAQAISDAVAQYGLEPGVDPRAQAITDAVNSYGNEPPFDPRAQAISDAVDQYGSQSPIDPRAQAISEAVSMYPASVARYYQQKFDRAIRLCTGAGEPERRAAYVYHVMYWYNLAVNAAQDADFLAAMGPDALSKMRAASQSCLSFELDFDSSLDVTTPELSYQIHLRSEKVKVRFQADGSLVEKGSQPLVHLTYQVSGVEQPVCSQELVYPDGTLTLYDGSLAVNYDQMKLNLKLWPDAPAEVLRLNCPLGPVDLALSWLPLFYFLHQDIVDEPYFNVTNWKYVGGELFAESIFEGRQMPIDEGTASITTFMDLVHTP